jgi:PAS domain S-box-containing protein
MHDTSSTTNKNRILIVEDELIIARGIQKRLLGMGYDITDIVPSGEEAVQSATENPPDLILMDINLQGSMDGIQAAESIRSSLDLPVIYLTAYADAESLGRAKLTEPFGYIVKPFQDHALQSAIEMALYKHRMESRLKRSEQWLATTLRSIGDAVVTTDVSGLVTYLNPVAESLIGLGRDDALARPLEELFRCRSETTPLAMEEIVRRVVDEGETVVLPGDAVVLTGTGRAVPIEAKLTPILGDKGDILGLVLVMLDVTEQRRTAETLRRSERILTLKNQIANIFLTIPDEQMFFQVLSVIREAVACAYALFGYVDEEGGLVIPTLTGDVWQECLIPGKAVLFPPEAWAGLWGRALREQVSFSGNGPFTVPQGHVAIDNFLAIPVVYRGTSIGLIALANRPGGFGDDDRLLLETMADRISPILQARLERDRLERKRGEAEEALRTSERLLRHVFEAIPDLFSVIDRDYRIIFSNWHGGYEYVPMELRDRQPYCYEAYYGMDAPCDVCHVTEVFRSGRPCSREKFNPRIGIVEIQCFPIFDEAGNVPLAIEYVRDITERRRVADALATEKERLAVTLRSIGDGVITTDTAGKVLLLNRVAEEMTGWSQEDAAGKPFDEVFRIIDEKSGERCPSPVEHVLASGLVVELSSHTILIARDGRERTIADSGAPIRDRESRVVGVVLVFRDITEKQKMEEELFNARKLESLGILAGGIAHDFNNLLTAILGNISLSRMQLSGDDRLQRSLDEAERASLRARDLTQQLLTFSRGGAPVRKTVSLGGIIREAATFALSGSRATCRFLLPDDLHPVDVDEGQFSQVINNLVINADQAMPGGGEMEISCANITLTEEQHLPLPEGTYVRISVRDRGEGISEDILPHIFDPYFTTKKEGKGLGLATVYSIVRNHDGHVSVSSVPGKGTTFVIHLPASGGCVVAPLAEEPVLTAGRGRILVMDDEESIREVAGEMLSLLGYEVDVARDGAEAVELYRRAREGGCPFSAVLMDLTIPGAMGGREAIGRLREIDESVVGVVSSGYSNDPIMADYRSFGFSGVITKPYRVAELKKVLDEVVARRDVPGPGG